MTLGITYHLLASVFKSFDGSLQLESRKFNFIANEASILSLPANLQGTVYYFLW
jgi:hypothetical protein